MNESQLEPEMDWDEPSSTETLMNAEENTASTVSVVSSALYADEPVIEKGNLHLQFKGRFILTSVKSGLMLIDQPSGTYSSTI